MSRTRSYNSWRGMLDRCQNPRVQSYPIYGGRGITVCERWRKFENFYADMGDPPSGMSLDRINPDGHYEPGNVRWATSGEQARNQRRNVYVTDGGITQTLTDWAETKGIKQNTLLGRYRRGIRPPELWRGEVSHGR